MKLANRAGIKGLVRKKWDYWSTMWQNGQRVSRRGGPMSKRSNSRGNRRLRHLVTGRDHMSEGPRAAMALFFLPKVASDLASQDPPEVLGTGRSLCHGYTG